MFIEFQYDLNKDIENYIAVARAKYKGGDSKILNLFTEKFGEDLNSDNLGKFIKEFIEDNKIDLNQSVKHIQESWSLVENEFFNRMKKIFGCPPPANPIQVYLTTNDRCTYAKSFFFVNVLSTRPKRIIMHELLHLCTCLVFKDELSKLDKESAYNIKETLTELLNLEFSDLIEEYEKGYPQHLKYRELMRQYWLENKNIKHVFDKLIFSIKKSDT
ncbi:MAG: hypothetical protein WC459_02625 [Patescibacteria group bacterium]